MNPGAKMTEKRIKGKRRGQMKNDFSLICNSQQEIGRKDTHPGEQNNLQKENLYLKKRFLGVSGSKMSKETLDLLPFYFKNSL